MPDFLNRRETTPKSKDTLIKISPSDSAYQSRETYRRSVQVPIFKNVDFASFVTRQTTDAGSFFFLLLLLLFPQGRLYGNNGPKRSGEDAFERKLKILVSDQKDQRIAHAEFPP